MNPAFDWLWETTWQASLLVLFVVGAQRLFRRWLTAEWRDLLWWLVVVRLCVPVLPESSFSVFNGFSGTDLSFGSVELERLDHPVEIPLASSVAGGMREESSEEQLAVVSAPVIGRGASTVNWNSVLQTIWLAGTGLTFSLTIWAYWRLRRRIARLPEVRSGRLVMLLDSARRSMKLRRPIPLLESEEALGPALVGLWRPRLVIPKGLAEELSDEEIKHVFLHECGHLRRFDLVNNWLLAALQALHWFNPVMWWAFRRMRADRELACDELTMRVSRDADSVTYGETIVRLLERAAHGGRPGVVGIVEKHADIRERIRMIAAFHRSSRWSIVAVTLMFALGMTMLTDAKRPAAAPEIARSPVIVSETGTGIMRANLLERVENLVWQSRVREEWALAQVDRSAAFDQQAELWQQARWFHVKLRDRILQELDEEISGDEDRFRLLERERGLWRRQLVRLCETKDLSLLRNVSLAVQANATDNELVRVAESLRVAIDAVDSGKGPQASGASEFPAKLREWKNSVVSFYNALVREAQTMRREALNGRLRVHQAKDTGAFVAEARERIASEHFRRAESLLEKTVAEDPRRFVAYAFRRLILERRMAPFLYQSTPNPK